MIKFINLFGFLNFTDLVFIALFLVVFIFFLREFKMTSKKSWVVLLGLTALGGFFVLQAWRRKKLLEQFEEREKALKKVEEEYNNLKAQAKITEAAYQNAKNDLERAKVQTGLAIMKADAELAQQVSEIERDYQTMTVDESVARIKAALQPK